MTNRPKGIPIVTTLPPIGVARKPLPKADQENEAEIDDEHRNRQDQGEASTDLDQLAELRITFDTLIGSRIH